MSDGRGSGGLRSHMSKRKDPSDSIPRPTPPLEDNPIIVDSRSDAVQTVTVTVTVPIGPIAPRHYVSHTFGSFRVTPEVAQMLAELRSGLELTGEITSQKQASNTYPIRYILSQICAQMGNND